MNIPMIGSLKLLVHAVKPYSIHGDSYFELQVALLDDPTATQGLIKTPSHLFANQTPRPGDQWEITFLMSQASSAKKLT